MAPQTRDPCLFISIVGKKRAAKVIVTVLCERCTSSCARSVATILRDRCICKLQSRAQFLLFFLLRPRDGVASAMDVSYSLSLTLIECSLGPSGQWGLTPPISLSLSLSLSSPPCGRCRWVKYFGLRDLHAQYRLNNASHIFLASPLTLLNRERRYAADN